MNRILRKRFPRQIRADFFRLGSLFLMIALCMYIIIALVDAAEVVIVGTETNQAASRIEDGQFTVFNALTDEQISTLTGTGAVIEPHISYDLTLDDGSVIRIFKNRELIDTVVLDCGRYAAADDEIILEKRYCEEHDISVGNVLTVGGRNITVTGIGSSVDYDAPLKKLSDTAVDSTVFGTGFVTPGGYDLLRSIGAVGSEDLTYAFLLNGRISADDLKQMIRDLEFDYRSVEDPYYLEMLDDTYGRRDEIRDGISDLADGAEQLYDGAGELYDGINDAYEGSEELADGAAELYDGVGELYDGAGKLYDGISELKEQSDELLDEIFTESPDNLISFILKEDNLRIGGAAGDIEINKTIGLVDGIVVIILFAYVLSVFVINQIREESSTIGALYALGVKKKDLMRHYIFMPTVISLLGGICGAAAGLSGLGSSWQTSDSYSYYSIPVFDKFIPGYLIVYALVMPPVVSIIVNFLVINKSLSRTALSLLRNEQKASKARDIRLPDMPFMRKFMIRQMLRERRTVLTIILGMVISLMIFMMGLNCFVLCKNMGEKPVEDTLYRYMYTYKYPSEEVPEGGEAVFVTSLQKEAFGYTLDITVMGIDDDNPYIDVDTVKGRDSVVISDAVATKYGLGTGDMLVLEDKADDIYYAFKVEEIVPYSQGLTVFMDIDSCRELFGEDDDYYNAVMSESELDIDEGRLYSVTDKADIEKAAGVFVDLMKPLYTLLITMSTVIFCLVMFLMTSVMIDRASFGISLMKIFGFRGKEVKRLYLDGNRIAVMLGSLVSIPLAKIITDKLFPMFVSNVA
nr:ABC transporter permease [Lachnospiraceae bacterium]